MKYIILAGAMLSLAACATGGSSWTQQSWLGQKAKDFNSGPWKFSAAPVRGNGFKMQFKINLNDISAGSGAEGDLKDPTEAEIIEAAKAAAPEGCAFKSLTKTENGDYEADYTCG
jgi:hypothetical protein